LIWIEKKKREDDEEEGDCERKGENPRDAATTHAEASEFFFCFSFSLLISLSRLGLLRIVFFFFGFLTVK
jgi:hypothetical protein